MRDDVVTGVQTCALPTSNEDTILHANLPTFTSGSDDPATLQAVVSGQTITFGTAFHLASGATLTLNADGSYVYNGDTITGRKNTPLYSPHQINSSGVFSV